MKKKIIPCLLFPASPFKVPFCFHVAGFVLIKGAKEGKKNMQMNIFGFNFTVPDTLFFFFLSVLKRCVSCTITTSSNWTYFHVSISVLQHISSCLCLITMMTITMCSEEGDQLHPMRTSWGCWEAKKVQIVDAHCLYSGNKQPGIKSESSHTAADVYLFICFYFSLPVARWCIITAINYRLCPQWPLPIAYSLGVWAASCISIFFGCAQMLMTP